MGRGLQIALKSAEIVLDSYGQGEELKRTRTSFVFSGIWYMSVVRLC